jgi:hypothetical protein
VNEIRIFSGIRGAHVAVNHADDRMTVTAPLDTMPADARDHFLRTCRELAAEQDVTLRFVRAARR